MGRLTRFSVAPVVRRFYRSMSPDNRRLPNVSTLLVLFGLPLAIGAVFALFGADGLTRAAITPVVAALGVLIGAFLTGFVTLLNLRIKIRDDENLSYRTKLSQLVSDTGTACIYLIVACLTTVAMSLGTVLLWPLLTETIPYGIHVALGLIVALLAHAVLVGLTLMRRLFGIYEQLFRNDFVRITAVESNPDQRDSA